MKSETPPDSKNAVPEHLERIWRRAYDASTKDDLRALYADWAETYDDDHRAIGFIAHRKAAELLARHTVRQDTARVLDAGAGTGHAGEELARLGFRDITAVDLSADMLERASQKDVYTRTLVADLSLPIDSFTPASFDAAILVGVFSYGQAPPEALDEVIRLVRPGGLVVLTARTDFHAEDAMGIRSRMEALERNATWRLLEVTDALPYLPKKDPDATFHAWCFRVTGHPDGEPEPGFDEAVRDAFESSSDVKSIDHRWIWDSTASRLYNRYTRTKGYYLTDCELEILSAHGAEIAGTVAGPCEIVELGCGSARKIQHVLRARVDAGAAVRYRPIDVSKGALAATQAAVRESFGARVEVTPIQGMFEAALDEVEAAEDTERPPRSLFFFGSSIGNFESLDSTVEFLAGLRARMRTGDRLVVGVDLHKDEDVLARAYNEESACRDFFVHMIRRINEQLGADFDPRGFELASTYEAEPEWRGVTTRRVSLRVAPTVPQRAWIRELGLEAELTPDQAIEVGISRKFETESLRATAAAAGLELRQQWLDSKGWFSLNEFVPQGAGAEAP